MNHVEGKGDKDPKKSIDQIKSANIVICNK